MNAHGETPQFPRCLGFDAAHCGDTREKLEAPSEMIQICSGAQVWARLRDSPKRLSRATAGTTSKQIILFRKHSPTQQNKERWGEANDWHERDSPVQRRPRSKPLFESMETGALVTRPKRPNRGRKEASRRSGQRKTFERALPRICALFDVPR